mmetsp:Transcript_20014/g.40992  ORF Transcript_20014/g.40992 Transcript_20014/m.40992 type:complete len:141 (+) Transcript_20014:207-629(+)
MHVVKISLIQIIYYCFHGRQAQSKMHLLFERFQHDLAYQCQNPGIHCLLDASISSCVLILYFAFQAAASFCLESNLSLRLWTKLSRLERCSLTVGRTSLTVRSTKTPPTSRNARRSGSNGSKVSSTSLCSFLSNSNFVNC